MPLVKIARVNKQYSLTSGEKKSLIFDNRSVITAAERYHAINLYNFDLEAYIWENCITIT